MINFKIKNTGLVSSEFLNLNLTTFSLASQYIKQLPYHRNKDKEDKLTVLKDSYGTCSTKHALLAELVIENKQPIDLMLGIFKMDAKYSKAVGKVLEKYNLPYILEAHNYLKYKYKRYDFTNPASSPKDFEDMLITEQVIKPNQITSYKVQFHKKVLSKWIDEENLSYSLDKIWVIREECIAALSTT